MPRQYRLKCVFSPSLTLSCSMTDLTQLNTKTERLISPLSYFPLYPALSLLFLLLMPPLYSDMPHTDRVCRNQVSSVQKRRIWFAKKRNTMNGIEGNGKVGLKREVSGSSVVDVYYNLLLSSHSELSSRRERLRRFNTICET